ncbi:hypothetical protein GF312_07470 [Candidatus Poribacteria bacterium]|nr:hypothetical protein [Candidatus Poribacteria bacterium]
MFLNKSIVQCKILCILISITFSIVLFCGCGEDEGEEEVKRELVIDDTSITLYDLQGTYNLIGVIVTCDNGNRITQDDFISYSGKMTITSDGRLSQEIIINGQTTTTVATCKLATNDTLYFQSVSPACDYSLKYEVSGNKLTTFLASGSCGISCSETDVWQKTSSSVPPALL